MLEKNVKGPWLDVQTKVCQPIKVWKGLYCWDFIQHFYDPFEFSLVVLGYMSMQK